MAVTFNFLTSNLILSNGVLNTLILPNTGRVSDTIMQKTMTMRYQLIKPSYLLTAVNFKTTRHTGYRLYHCHSVNNGHSFN